METLQSHKTYREYEIKESYINAESYIKEFVDWILHIGDGDMDLNEL